MTVKGLIDELKKYPEDCEVQIDDVSGSFYNLRINEVQKDSLVFNKNIIILLVGDE